MVVDDDTKALMGKIQERARIIVDGGAPEALLALIAPLGSASSDAAVTSDVFGLLARLAIRDECVFGAASSCRPQMGALALALALAFEQWPVRAPEVFAAEAE